MQGRVCGAKSQKIEFSDNTNTHAGQTAWGRGVPLDHNPDLLDKLADPEVGDNEHEVRLNGKWEPYPNLNVAYDFNIDRMATGRWRWFHGQRREGQDYHSVKFDER